MANNIDRFGWYLSQCKTGQKWLSMVDGIEHWSFDLQLHDWGICTGKPFSNLLVPSCLWLFYMEQNKVEVLDDE